MRVSLSRRAGAEAIGTALLVLAVVGSGISADNIAQYAAADAYVVGSWLKQDGMWTRPIDPARLDALVRAIERLPAR